MRRIAQLTLCILLGLGLAWATSPDIGTLSHSPAYRIGAYLLLAIGLYGATYGIDLHQAAKDRNIIIAAVTVGVIVKAVLIGVTLALAWQNPLFLILGVAVAQVDPLSVAALMSDQRMSIRARNVLAAWSSFDDPFTVILSIYAAAVAVNTFGIGNHPPTNDNPALIYALDLGGNIALAGIAYGIWKLIGNRPVLQYAALLAFLAVAVTTGWMLAIAIIGLFARPRHLNAAIGHITQAALYTATIGLGFLLIDGVQIWQGLTLGATAYLAHIAVAAILTRGMPRPDRWHLALAQQNGITAIILALTLQIQFDQAVGVIAPAIITVNLIHTVANHLYDRRHSNGPSPK